MIARCHGGGQVEAMCLVDGGPKSGRYTTSRGTCAAWESGHYGAVDDPPNYGEEVRPLYEAEKKKARKRNDKPLQSAE